VDLITCSIPFLIRYPAETVDQIPCEMSLSEIPHNQYTGQRADGHATQIVGIVGTVYLSQAEDSKRDCLNAL
jgi:hypothetical protein